MSINTFEDKSIGAPLPRSIPALRGLMNEVQVAMQSKQRGALQALVEELHNTRRKLSSEMYEAARAGAPSSVIEAYSGISNESLTLYAEAQGMASGLGALRS